MKIAKERIIFDNYNPDKYYPDADVREALLECDGYSEDEISENDIWERRNFEMETWWDDEQMMLKNFFDDKTVVMSGTIGRWNGIKRGCDIGDFWKLFGDITQDCHYWKLYDMNGHFYITCSHHDGTNCVEIKVVTNKGIDYLERCNEDWRTPNGNQLMNKYTRLPRFAEKVFGCKAREYEESTKEKLINKLNNNARSNYV